jgi:hypothetical protein
MSASSKGSNRNRTARAKNALPGQLAELQAAVDRPLEGGVSDNPTYLIDDVTRAEITDLIKRQKLDGARTLWEQAKAGTDVKFKARTATQARYEKFLDKPGLAQTRSASLLDAYKGKR